jgi:N-acetylmuramoyl-L-alanine amidase
MKRLIFVLIIALLSLVTFHCTSRDSSKVDFDVVIDAAHGGTDPGGILKIDSPAEKDIVLSIAQKLKTSLEKQNLRVFMTRDTDQFVSFKNRMSGLEKSKSRAIVSIHTNMSTDSTKHGYNTFYQESNAESMLLDKYIHQELNQENLLSDRGSQAGPFYMLTETTIPSVVIYLGYMSNSKDFRVITEDSNQSKMADLIASAVDKYLKSSENTL